MRADVIDKATGKSVEISNDVIDLTNSSVVRLDLDRAQIASLERQGNSLIVHLTSGETIRIDNFYPPLNGPANDLVLREGDRLWLADAATQGAARFTALQTVDELLIGAEATAAAGGGSGLLLPALLGAAGVAGGAAALSGGGGSGGTTPPPAVDTTPPTAPTASVNSTGTSVSGTGEAGATVQVRDASGVSLGTGTVASNGSYVVTLTTPQANGQTVTVTQADAAGNVSPGTTARAPDITAPGAPTGTVNEAGTIMTGNGEVGATVTIRSAAGAVIGTGTVDAQGHYTITLTAPQTAGGLLSVSQADAAGNASAVTRVDAPDRIAPAAPTAVFNAETLTVSGVAEPGATVTVRSSTGTVLGGTVAEADGDYVVSLPTSSVNGGTFTVSQTDHAGNASPNTTVSPPDLSPPSAPTVTIAADADGEEAVGTGEPGATIVVMDANDGTELGTGTVSTLGTFRIRFARALVAGERIDVVQVDEAGNVSTSATATAPDLTAPDAPTATIEAGGTAVTGAGEPWATVTVTDAGGTTIGTAMVQGDGGYFVTLTTPQANGETVLVSQTDQAGNRSSATTVIAPDITPPPAPVGTVSTDGTQVTGTGEAGATVTVRDPAGTILGTAVVAANGSYTVTLSTPQLNGQVLDIVQRDVAGNISTDTRVTAPDTTFPLGLTAAVGSSGAVVMGSGEPRATVTVRDAGGTVIGSAVVGANGSYSVPLNPAQVNGETVQVVQADAAGNASAPVSAIAPDLTAPAAPAGTVSSNGTSITGTGEAGATLVVRDPGGTVIGTTTVAGNGSYTVTLTTPQANGQQLQIVQADAAGNVSSATTVTAPDITAPLGLTAAVNANGTVVNGSGEAGATVTVRDPGGTVIGTATVAANGSYSVVLTTAQANGQLLQVTQADVAGNPSTPVPTQAPDITAPAAPTATVAPDGTTVTGTGEAGATLTVRTLGGTVIGTTIVLGNGSYSVTLTAPQTNGEVLSVRQADAAGNASPTVPAIAPDITAPVGLTATVNATGTTVSGSGEAGATVTVRDPLGTAIGTATVAANGSYSVVLTTAQANGQLLQVTQTDAAGNPSTPVPAQAPDITPPAAPTGTVAPDGASVSGTGEANATLVVRDPNGSIIGTTTVLGNGTYSVTLTTPQTNGETLTLNQADQAGNVSPNVSATAPDITPPTGLTATVNATGTIVSGSGEAGATVTVRDPLGTAIGTATVAANGSYSVVLTTAQANGELLQVTQVDGAANPSLSVPAQAPDITMPGVPTATVDGTGTSVSGTGEAGATLTVRDPLGNVIGTTTVLGNGTYTVTLTTPQANGQLLSVSQADLAGNVSANVPALAPDITAPTGLTATVNGTGTIVTGTGEAGATVTVRDPLGTAIGTAVVGLNGAYAIVLTTPQANGQLLQVTQVDLAANPSTPVPALAPDITAPIAPSFTVSPDGTTVSGSGEPGATVTITSPTGAIVGSGPVAGNGSFTIILTTPQANGGTLSATQADVAGNVSLTGTAPAPDITPPNLPAASLDATGSVVTGTGEPGATVTITDPFATIVGIGTVSAAGTFSITLSVPQINNQILSVVQTDPAGNPSPALPLTAPDLTAPGAPAAIVAADGASISGVGEPGATLVITDPQGTPIGSVTVTGGGTFTTALVPPQINGELLTLVQTDLAGNVSLPGNATAPDLVLNDSPNAPTATVAVDGATVFGTGDAGNTISVTSANGTVLGTAIVTPGGTYIVILNTPQTNGELLHVVQIDGDGDLSPPTNVNAPDITPPAAPVASIDASGTIVTGTGEVGATVRVVNGVGTVLGTATVDANGNYAVTLSSPQSNGQALTVIQADAAANDSPATPLTAPDTTAPLAPTATVAADGLTVSGTGEAGATVTIRAPGGASIGTAVVAPGGTYTVTLTTPQTNGEVLTAQQADPAGNLSPTVSTTAPDLTPPAAATASIDATGTVVSGTGEVGATVTVRNALGVPIGSTVVSADGSYSVVLATPQTNGQALQLVQTDAAGLLSPVVPITAPDTTAPLAPTGTVSLSGTTVVGFGEPGATVTVRDAGGVSLGTATVAGNGSYTVTLSTSQTNGQLLTLSQADAAGNVSANLQVAAPDSTAPNAPSATVSGNGAIVTGTGEAGATVTVRDAGGSPLGTALVAANGAYAVALITSQANGQSLQVTQADAAGNVSLATTVTAPDITPPAAPTGSVSAGGTTVTGTGEAGATVTVRDAGGASLGTAVVAGNGSYTVTLTTSQTNGQLLSLSQADAAGNRSPVVPLTAPDTTPPAAPTATVGGSGAIVTGTGEPGATVTVRDAVGTPLGTALVAANGAFVVTLTPLQTNGQTLQVTQADAAGNVSTATPALAPDFTAPLAPTGSLSAGGTTVVGTGESGATVTVRNAVGVAIGNAVVAANGSYTVTLNAPQTNGQLLSLSQADAAGNVSVSVPLVAPDTTPPAAPSATVSGSGTIVTGAGEPGATVTVRDAGGVSLGTALVAVNGAYVVTLAIPQVNGQSLQVTQADAAGNVSVITAAPAPDHTPPLAPSATINASNTVITGLGEPGATVTVRNAAGVAIGNAVVAVGGSYSVTLTAAPASGEVLTVTQNDPAGNASPVTVVTAPDITPPATPNVAINGTGTVVTGTGEAGATAEVRNAGGTLLGSATVASNGSFAVPLSIAQISGEALSVTLRDAAGNISIAAPITAPFDLAAFDNAASATVQLSPVTTNANLGSANYTALVSLGLLNLNAQVLATPNVQFTVAPGHSLNASFTYDALLSIGVLSGYSVVVQRFNGTNWVAVDGNGTSSLLQLTLLNGDLVSSQILGPGQYRAFVAFDGALGVGLLGGLNVTGVDSDFTDVGSVQTVTLAGNVITDPGPTGQVDIVSPQVLLQSVTVNGVTTTVGAGGSTIQGSWGTLVINQNGSYTYTPANAAAIGHIDSFTYTLIDPSDGELESATLSVTVTSPAITGAPIAVNDIATATATFANVVTTTPAEINASFATPTALVITGAQTGTTTHNFNVGANSTSDVTISAIQSSGLSVLPTYTITVRDAGGTVVGTITQAAVANLGLGTGIALTLPHLAAGTYSYTVSSTNVLGTGYGTNVYIGQTVTHLDQYTLTGSTVVQGELLANDTLGTSFVAVRMLSGGSFIEVGETPLTIVGAHGTLTVNETGHYSYTPSASLAYSGTDPVDSFTYQVLQPNGTVATARLDVTVDINNGVTPTLSLMEAHGLADAVPMTLMAAAEPAHAAPDASHKLAALALADHTDSVDTLLGQYLQEHRETTDPAASPVAAETTPTAPAIAATPMADDPLNYLVTASDLDHDRHQLVHAV